MPIKDNLGPRQDAVHIAPPGLPFVRPRGSRVEGGVLITGCPHLQVRCTSDGVKNTAPRGVLVPETANEDDATSPFPPGFWRGSKVRRKCELQQLRTLAASSEGRN